MTNDIATLILAAGASNRIGQPKQLLTYKNGTFISNTISEALKSEVGDVFVVYGAYRHQIESELRTYQRKVTTIYNDNWNQGMGASLATGVTAVQEAGNYKAVIIMLADQVMVEATSIQRLLQLHQQTEKGIVHSYYGKDYGPPTLFASKYFEDLKSLTGDIGAKPIIKKNISDLAAYYHPAAKIDIDLLDEYYELVKMEMM